MIDPKVLRDDPARVRAAQAKRGLSDEVVDRALAADTARRTAISTFEAKRAEQKQLGKQIAAGAGRGEGRAPGPDQGPRRGGEGRRGRPDRGRGDLALGA